MATFFSRLASLLSFRKVWGLALTALGLVLQAIHWGWLGLDILGRLDVLWRIVAAMGGTPATIASIVSSWEFSLALIVVGIGYTVFVGEPHAGTQRHVWWPYLAASVFFICLATMGSVAIYGAVELYIRQQIDEGLAGIPRGPEANNPNRPQTPFTAADWGVITPDQMRILIQELPKLGLKRADFFSVPNDNIGWQYWHQFNDIFQRSGIAAPRRGDQMPRGPEEEGLMLEVRDPSNVPESAKKLLASFAIANINIRVIKAPKDFLGADVEFAVFIGPAPIRWR